MMLNSGLDGVKNKMPPPPATNVNIYDMSANQMRRAKIQSMPGSLLEALAELKKSKLAKETLGDHIFEKYVISKEKEWDSFRISVTDWELDNYLNVY
ncbi:MAG: glutamine synthetase [Desulfobulbaceae bacterium]|nr:glutamine synthetase [Desulfobulbaceae bacterium]